MGAVPDSALTSFSWDDAKLDGVVASRIGVTNRASSAQELIVHKLASTLPAGWHTKCESFMFHKAVTIYRPDVLADVGRVNVRSHFKLRCSTPTAVEYYETVRDAEVNSPLESHYGRLISLCSVKLKSGGGHNAPSLPYEYALVHRMRLTRLARSVVIPCCKNRFGIRRSATKSYPVTTVALTEDEYDLIPLKCLICPVNAMPIFKQTHKSLDDVEEYLIFPPL